MKPIQLIGRTQEFLKDEEFKSRHRKSPQWFTRDREFTFSLVMLLIMQNTMKSLQLLLNEVFGQISSELVTNNTFTQARSHLQHSAFMELTPKAILAEYYHVSCPTSAVGELYHLRWGIETLYGVVNTRLQRENFRGQTAESVRQNFYATLFITNLESVLTAEATIQLEKQTSMTLPPQQVNQAVSFNAIKNSVMALVYLENSSEEIFRQLTQLFLTNPCSVRPQRSVPRRQRSPTQRLNYPRLVKKICF